MDLTKLPQELLFFEKRSIDDFDIDNELSSDGILYNRIINIPLTVPVGWDKEKWNRGDRFLIPKAINMECCYL